MRSSIPPVTVTEYQSVGRDITEEKETQAALQDSEQRFRKIFENSTLGMALSTSDFRFVSVNQAMIVMTGYSEEELLKMSFKDITHPHHLEGDEEHIRALATGKIPVYSTEKRYIRKDGSILWGLLKVTTIRDQQGTLRFFAAMIEDITERKKTEASLQESEERYRQLVEQSPDGILVHTSGLIVYANPTAFRLLGAQDRKDLAGRHVMNFVHPDFKDTVTERVRVMTEEMKPVALLEEKFLRLDGTSVDVEVAAIPFVFKGKPSVQVTFRDITKRKRTEEILRIAQEKYTKAFLLAPHAITISELFSGKFIEVNDAATKMFGYSRDELLGKSALELGIWLKNGDRARFIDMVRKDGRVSRFEITERRKSGELFYALVDADTISIGGADFVIAIIRDMTSHKRADEALHDSEELDRAIINTSPDNITLTDLSGTILFVSPASVSMFGLPDQAAALGKSIFDFIVAQEDQRGRQAVTTLLKTGKVIGEFNALKSDGSLFPIEAHASLMRDKAGNPWRIIIIVRDITERKRAEEALRQASKKLTLLSSITRHDIDNQIVALMGFLKILEKKQPDPTLGEYFQKISATVKRISTMIRFTKQYEQIGVHAPVWQDIRMLVRTASKEISLGKIKVKNDIPEMMEVFADPLIVKVFYNLMDNAVRYGEKITTIRFFVQESGDNYLILCEDDGVGVPGDEKERIFDRNFGRHTGLGLFLSREILSITGITIRETGEPGKGARFEITVPGSMYRITDFQKKIIDA